MKQLVFIVAVCLALTARSQTDSVAMKVSAQLQELSNNRRHLVNKIDGNTAFRLLYDTLLNCADGCDAVHHFYYSYAYDSTGKLQKVKVFDDKTKTLKEYHYSNNKVLQAKCQTFLSTDKASVNTSSLMFFDFDYNIVSYAKANPDDIEHMQSFIEGYKLMVRFYDLLVKANRPL